MDNTNKALSIDEHFATKILLEIYAIKENFKNIDLKNEDSKEASKKLKGLEKNISSLENNLIEKFNINIPVGTKKAFLKLKDEDLGEDILNVVKYL